MSNSIMFYRKLEEQAEINQIPLNGEFEITTRCNLNCVMCYTRKSPNNKEVIRKELTANEIIALATEARNQGMLYALITGGEIFLRNDFKKIYEALVNLGLLIKLYTNGTLINEEIANWLALIPPYMLSITLYGGSMESYKKVTGSSDGFDLVIKALDMLLERKINVEIKTIWLKDIINDYPMIEKIAVDRGLSLKVVNYVFPSIDSENSDPIGNRLDPVRLAEMTLKLQNSSNLIIDTDSYNILKMNNSSLAFDCAAGKRLFNISWDGKIRSCALINDIVYDVNPKIFMDTFKKINDDYGKIRKYEVCDNCEYKYDCIVCPARRYIETKNYYEKPEYLCSYAKALSLLKSK